MLTTDTVMILLAAMFPQLWPFVIVAFLFRHSGLLWRGIYTTCGVLGASQAEIEGSLLFEAMAWALPAAGDEIEALPETPSPRLFIPVLTIVPTMPKALPAPAPMAVADQPQAHQGEQAGQETRSSSHTAADTAEASAQSVAAPLPPLARLGLDEVPGGLLPVGISTHGPVYLDLDKTPHALLAGASGSGKSTLLHLWIAALAYHHSAEDLGLLLADTKMSEFFVWEKLPHLAKPIAYELEDVASAAAWLGAELERRKQLWRALGVRTLAEAREEVDGPLPCLVFVLDEFADVPELFADGGALAKVARQGRVFGIHLIAGTQRPDAGVLGGQIDANLEARWVARLSPRSAQVMRQPEAARIGEQQGRALWVLGGRAVEVQTFLATPANPTALARKVAAAERRRTEAKQANSRLTTGLQQATEEVSNAATTLATTLAITEKTAPSAAVSGDAIQAARLFLGGSSPAEVVRELRGVESNQGRRYQAALDEVLGLIRAGTPIVVAGSLHDA